MTAESHAAARRLGLSEKDTAWLVGGDPPEPYRAAPLELPDDAAADALLTRLRVSDLDRADTLAARPSPIEHPDLWAVLTRAHDQLVADLGGTAMLPWPALPDHTGPVGRHLYVWCFLSVVPYVRAYHREHGIADEVSWDTLGDLGQQMGVHRRIFGTGGLHTQWWLTLAFRGALYELGRLQFNRGTVWFDGAVASEGLRPPRRGDQMLGVHIPERGPMDVAACEESIAWAREFFPRHFPDERPRYATCLSWLLDDQLADYLPADSNIVRFQRRFHLVPLDAARGQATTTTGAPEGWTAGDRAIVEFVFRRLHDGPDLPSGLLDSLPRTTTLERAVVDHLRAGRHWHARTGWFPLGR